MQRPLTRSGVLLALAIIMRTPDGSWTKVNIEPTALRAVDVYYSSGLAENASAVRHKTFGRETLERLEELWGGRGFELTKVKTDLGCVRTRTWWLESGGQKRTVCHNQELRRRLDRIQSVVQLLMR